MSRGLEREIGRGWLVSGSLACRTGVLAAFRLTANATWETRSDEHSLTNCRSVRRFRYGNIKTRCPVCPVLADRAQTVENPLRPL